MTDDLRKRVEEHCPASLWRQCDRWNRMDTSAECSKNSIEQRSGRESDENIGDELRPRNEQHECSKHDARESGPHRNGAQCGIRLHRSNGGGIHTAAIDEKHAELLKRPQNACDRNRYREPERHRPNEIKMSCCERGCALLRVKAVKSWKARSYAGSQSAPSRGCVISPKAKNPTHEDDL